MLHRTIDSSVMLLVACAYICAGSAMRVRCANAIRVFILRGVAREAERSFADVLHNSRRSRRRRVEYTVASPSHDPLCRVLRYLNNVTCSVYRTSIFVLQWNRTRTVGALFAPHLTSSLSSARARLLLHPLASRTGIAVVHSPRVRRPLCLFSARSSPVDYSLFVAYSCAFPMTSFVAPSKARACLALGNSFEQLRNFTYAHLERTWNVAAAAVDDDID